MQSFLFRAMQRCGFSNATDTQRFLTFQECLLLPWDLAQMGKRNRDVLVVMGSWCLLVHAEGRFYGQDTLSVCLHPSLHPPIRVGSCWTSININLVYGAANLFMFYLLGGRLRDALHSWTEAIPPFLFATQDPARENLALSRRGNSHSSAQVLANIMDPIRC